MLHQKMDHPCTIEDLHVEVHRITNCPYTPSLKVPKIKDGERKDPASVSVLRALDISVT